MGHESVAACVVGLLKKLVVVVWMLWDPPLDPFAAAPCPPTCARFASQAHAARSDGDRLLGPSGAAGGAERSGTIVQVVQLRSA